MLIDAELALCIDLLGDTASSDADAAVSFVVFVGVSISTAAELWHEFNTAKNNVVQKIIFLWKTKAGIEMIDDDDCRRLLLRVFSGAIIEYAEPISLLAISKHSQHQLLFFFSQ